MNGTDNYQGTTDFRRYDIDWLRILAIWLVLVYHSARIFDGWQGNYVSNAPSSLLLTYFCVALRVWHMPLIFLLAGCTTWYALELRNGAGYLKERFTRLFVPLVFGLLVIVPPQAYIARFKAPGYSESYLAFLWDYFKVKGDMLGFTGQFTPGHLWFILYLFCFSLITLPLLLYLKKHRGILNWLTASCAGPWTIHLLAVPLLLSQMLPDLSSKNPFFLVLFFVYGYVLASNVRLSNTIARQKALLLALAAGTTVLVLGLWPPGEAFQPAATGNVLLFLTIPLNAWFWVLALVGYGQTYLNHPCKGYRYANESSYPFYIVHQTLVQLVGFYVVPWQMNLWLKFALIVIASFLLTVLLYECVIARIAVLRFLFGMKPRKQA